MTKSAGPAIQRLHADFGSQVEFLALYVREAYPGDHYVQPEDLETKLTQAHAYAARDGVTWPVAVDDPDGTLHRVLDPKPHAAYVVDAVGDVAFRALWANDEGPLREALAAVAAGRRGALGESEAKAVPMVRGMGSMWETLSAAGPVALRDVARQVPPMWILGRIAAVFRPLRRSATASPRRRSWQRAAPQRSPCGADVLAGRGAADGRRVRYVSCRRGARGQQPSRPRRPGAGRCRPPRTSPARSAGR